MYCYDGASGCCQGSGVLCVIIGWVLSFRGFMEWCGWLGLFNHGCGRWRIIGDGVGLLIMVMRVLLVESVLVVMCDGVSEGMRVYMIVVRWDNKWGGDGGVWIVLSVGCFL